MAAPEKTRITQLIRPSEEPHLVPAFFLDSSTRVCMVDPQEIYRFSHLAPVIVLLPGASVINSPQLLLLKEISPDFSTKLNGNAKARTQKARPSLVM